MKTIKSCLFLLSLAAFSFSPSYAANPVNKLTEIQQKLINELKSVKEAGKKEESVLVKIEDITKGIRKKEEELRRIDARISRTQSGIITLSEEINKLSGELGNNRRLLEDHLRALYKQQYGGNALILISAEDNQDLMRKSRYLSLIAYHDSRVINKFSNEIREINLKKGELENLDESLRDDKENARQREKELKAERRKKDEMLSAIRGRRVSSENNIKELEESAGRLRDMIAGLKTKEIPKAILGDGFDSLKRHLPWPVEGRVLIPYGKYQSPEFDAPVFKNGIEIEAKPGDAPKAVAGGRVVYADRFEGLGTLLIIDHGSGYNSLYGNLSGISLEKGDLLIKGMDIGTISRSKLFNVPTLYFEIRHKGRPVDPAEWLGRES